MDEAGTLMEVSQFKTVIQPFSYTRLIASEYQPIFWKKKRFELKDKGCFWLSTEPDVVGSQSWDSACTLTHKKL